MPHEEQTQKICLIGTDGAEGILARVGVEAFGLTSAYLSLASHLTTTSRAETIVGVPRCVFSYRSTAVHVPIVSVRSGDPVFQSTTQSCWLGGLIVPVRPIKDA